MSIGTNRIQLAARPAEQSVASMARKIIRQRRERDEVLGARLFGEPSWDMLLHLVAESETGRAVSVANLCTAAGAPIDVGLRWISVLEQAGFVTTTLQPAENYRADIALTDGASARLRRLLQDWSGD